MYAANNPRNRSSRRRNDRPSSPFPNQNFGSPLNSPISRSKSRAQDIRRPNPIKRKSSSGSFVYSGSFSPARKVYSGSFSPRPFSSPRSVRLISSPRSVRSVGPSTASPRTWSQVASPFRGLGPPRMARSDPSPLASRSFFKNGSRRNSILTPSMKISDVMPPHTGIDISSQPSKMTFASWFSNTPADLHINEKRQTRDGYISKDNFHSEEDLDHYFGLTPSPEPPSARK